eukprot:5059092-Pleurochrysis_carterae.AAC.1
MEQHVNTKHAKDIMMLGLPAIAQPTVQAKGGSNTISTLPFSYRQAAKLWPAMIMVLWQSISVKTLIEPLTYSLGDINVKLNANGSEPIFKYKILNNHLEISENDVVKTTLFLPDEFARIRTVILEIPQVTKTLGAENTSEVKAEYIVLLRNSVPAAAAQPSASSSTTPQTPQT